MFITTIRYTKNLIYRKYHTVPINLNKKRKMGNALDGISKKLQDKPSLHLPGQTLKLATTTNGIIDAFVTYLYQFLNAIVIPIKIINDRKFYTHSYQTSYVFKSK